MIINEVLLFIFSTRNVTREIIQCIFAVAKPRRTIFKSSNSIQNAKATFGTFQGLT